MFNFRRRVIHSVAAMSVLGLPMGVKVSALNSHPDPPPEHRAGGMGWADKAGMVRAASETAVQVTIDNFTFSPATITVPVGTQVTWVNHDDVPHTVTSTTKPRLLASAALDTDQQYSHVFTAAGTYSYFCGIHPHMTGTVIVK